MLNAGIAGMAAVTTRADSVRRELSTETAVGPSRASAPQRGGRSWWAQLAFTCLNTGPTMVKKDIEELMNVKGIGEKSFLKLKPLVTLGDAKPAAKQ